MPDRHAKGRRARLTAALLATAVAVAVTASACSSSPDDKGSDGGTLVVQSGLANSPGILAVYEKLNKQFEDENPGVKVEFTAKSFDDLASLAKLQLSGTNPPDVTQVNRGYQALGAFVKGGLLTNMDDYAKKHGWDTRQTASQLQLNRFSTDGKLMGEGPLWGMSATTAWIGLLMNTEIAEKLGITEAPKTIAELEEQMQRAKAAGEIPMQFGSASGELAAWLLSELLLAHGGPQAVQDLVFHRANATFTSESAVWAAKTMKSWGDKGYFAPDWTAYKTDQVLANFISGKGLFSLTSSRFTPLKGTPEQTKKLRMVFFPSVSGKGIAAVGAGDIPWTIPVKAKKKDLSAKYIDFVTSQKAAEQFLAGGAIPSKPPADADTAINSANLPVPSQDALRNGLKLVGEGTPVPYVDWGAPELYPTISRTFDQLMSGALSVDGLLAELQKSYGPFVESLAKG
ncbi:extracellular solute-binding protein [Dactylosporangium fulvum]|uniref:Extracellular solute-binding protein n=1 Tax=Dactylosporangium fulvum TaxID=53359 RepID=A0ABY5VQQ6_9ACTN|nr:extracellular solute-binding protein [Dactylosporangium fulvum]UWP80107.1 extracellular solute-binding protein [Dactylosporangium fulvum]